MPPLAGTNQWEPGVVNRRLLFLRQCVRKHRNLAVRLGRLSFAPEDIISFIEDQPSSLGDGALEAQLLTEAAEISFVLGDTSTGVKILGEVVDRLLSRSDAQLENEYQGTLQQFVMASVFSGLTQRGSLRITDDGLVIAFDGRDSFFNWKHHIEVQELVRTLPLLFAIIASDEVAVGELGRFLGRSEFDRRLA